MKDKGQSDDIYSEQIHDLVTKIQTMGVPVGIITSPFPGQYIVPLELTPATAELFSLLIDELMTMEGPLTEDGTIFSRRQK